MDPTFGAGVAGGAKTGGVIGGAVGGPPGAAVGAVVGAVAGGMVALAVSTKLVQFGLDVAKNLKEESNSSEKR